MTPEWRSRYINSDADRLWLDEGLRNGYKLRPPAAPILGYRVWQWAGIRHIRSICHAVRAEVWSRRFARAGFIPPGYEAWIAHAIWKGWQ
jgi:hypothetical protein